MQEVYLLLTSRSSSWTRYKVDVVGSI